LPSRQSRKAVFSKTFDTTPLAANNPVCMMRQDCFDRTVWPSCFSIPFHQKVAALVACLNMPRPQSDFMDRSIETLFTREWVDLPSGEGDADAVADPSNGQSRTARLPRLNLDSLDNQPSVYSPDAYSDLDSDGEPARVNNVIATSQGDVWLSGNVVMCQCPECQAPVSVRLWLMVADCWNCQSAMELGFEQREAVEQLIKQSQPAMPAPATSIVPPRPEPVAARAPEELADNAPIESLNPHSSTGESRRLVDIIRKMTDTFPAWLVSLLVHLVLVLILALILLPQSSDTPQITLSTAVGPMDEVGGLVVESPPEAELEYDSIVPDNYDQVERELRDVRVAADQDARELLLDPEPVVELPTVDQVKDSITVRPNSRYTFAARDPRLRNEIVVRQGGTTLSEAAVSRGLRWLASVQNANGSWSLADYKRDRDSNRGDMAATALALLPFLGAGQTHEYGLYKNHVAAGLKWLIDHQKANGELMYGINTNAAIYAHGQASIVLVEALAMTGDERFREPAQKAIDYIQAFQHKHGGWRYRAQESGDTSVLGWQLMALQSARGSNTGLRVDQATLKLADQYLDMASRPYQSSRYKTAPTGTLYRYQPRERKPKEAMTAEGLLCRMYLGWKRDDARLLYGVNWLIDHALPDGRDRTHNLYYYYYATQVMHHFGGRHWETWNNHLRDLLVVKQQRKGKYSGSWNPKEFEYGDSGGRIYVTALAICTLEVYYRHLPLFKQLDLE